VRFVALVAVIGGCGRVGFDAGPTDGASSPNIAVVQTMATSSTTATSAIALPEHVQDHDALIVCFTFPSGGPTLQSIGDSLDNGYSVVAGPVVSNGFVHYVALASNVTGGSDAVTVTLSAAATAGWQMLALEYTGLALSDPFDTEAHDFGNSSDMSSGSVTTSSAHELLLAYGHASAPMAGPGFTTQASGNENLVEDQVVFATGDYTATGTTTSSIWTLILATFAGG
jgi:hypothetical protein